MNSYRDPAAKWLGSPNFSLNRDGHDMSPPAYIVMHTMVGTVTAANARFQQASQQASAHYGVGLDGSLVQWVDEKDASWAAGNYAVNLDAINIEHEDGGRYNDPRPPALKTASAALIARICARYGLPIDRSVIRLHKEVSVNPTACPDSLEVDEILRLAGQQGGTPDMTDGQIVFDYQVAQLLSFGTVDPNPQSQQAWLTAVKGGANPNDLFMGWYNSDQAKAYRAQSGAVNASGNFAAKDHEHALSGTAK